MENFIHKIAMMIEDMSTTRNWGFDGLQLFLKGVGDLYKKHVEINYILKNGSKIDNPNNQYKYYFKVEDNGSSSISLWCMDPSISFNKLI